MIITVLLYVLLLYYMYSMHYCIIYICIIICNYIIELFYVSLRVSMALINQSINLSLSLSLKFDNISSVSHYSLHYHSIALSRSRWSLAFLHSLSSPKSGLTPCIFIQCQPYDWILPFVLEAGLHSSAAETCYT